MSPSLLCLDTSNVSYNSVSAIFATTWSSLTSRAKHSTVQLISYYSIRRMCTERKGCTPIVHMNCEVDFSLPTTHQDMWHGAPEHSTASGDFPYDVIIKHGAEGVATLLLHNFEDIWNQCQLGQNTIIDIIYVSTACLALLWVHQWPFAVFSHALKTPHPLARWSTGGEQHHAGLQNVP